MATTTQKPELLVIVGPTASGKSALAMNIAEQFKGEIICADSRTIYKGMDIGTAKPTKADRQAIKHWGLDIVNPGQTYSAKQFKDYAEAAIKDIKSRGKLPILVGGTGLYIDSVIFDFKFRPVTTKVSRQHLESLSIVELESIISKKGYEMPQNENNKRHLIRTIESEGAEHTKSDKPRADALIIGINPGIENIEKIIKKRTQAMLEQDILAETKQLVAEYGEHKIIKTAGIMYKVCIDVITGRLDIATAATKAVTAERQYAKRQLTWLKRNQHIHWFSDKDAAYEYIKNILNN